MTVPNAYALCPSLYDRWMRLEEATENCGLDPALIAWSRSRARTLVSAQLPGDVPAAPDELLQGFAEQFWMDAHGITDDQASEVQELLGDAGLVAFAVLLGLCEVDARTEAMFA